MHTFCTVASTNELVLSNLKIIYSTKYWKDPDHGEATRKPFSRQKVQITAQVLAEGGAFLRKKTRYNTER
jgi:hypothetical protein